MQKAVVAFETALRTSSVGLLFFAGHAFQIDGHNYLAGTDTAVGSALAVKFSALDIDSVEGAMKSGAVRTGLIILDACRNDPFGGVRAFASNEMLRIFAPKGTLIAFSTSPGQTAGDGAGRNGYYTQALLTHIDTPNLLIETMFKRVRHTLNNYDRWPTNLVGAYVFNRRFSIPTQILSPAGY